MAQTRGQQSGTLPVFGATDPKARIGLLLLVLCAGDRAFVAEPNTLVSGLTEFQEKGVSTW